MEGGEEGVAGVLYAIMKIVLICHNENQNSTFMIMLGSRRKRCIDVPKSARGYIRPRVSLLSYETWWIYIFEEVWNKLEHPTNSLPLVNIKIMTSVSTYKINFDEFKQNSPYKCLKNITVNHKLFFLHYFILVYKCNKLFFT